MKLRLFWYQNLYFFTNVAYHCFPPTHSIILDIIRRNKLLLFGHILSHDRWSTGKDGIAWLSRRWTTERKTTEEMDTQHHGMDWTDIMWGCSTVIGSCNMEQDRIWLKLPTHSTLIPTPLPHHPITLQISADPKIHRGRGRADSGTWLRQWSLSMTHNW